jgi:hypothetical protein
MQSVQGLPIETIKKVTAKLTHEMVRIARIALKLGLRLHRQNGKEVPRARRT